MAWRIHDSVQRGEIDNRERGVVRGRLWLHGLADPAVLELRGNAAADLAGCLLTFENPGETIPMRTDASFNPLQRGTIGDLTASRKVRVAGVSLDDFIELHQQGKPAPERWANCLYLEWFSDANGRVVVESHDYKVTISAPAWRLTPGEEQERQQQAAAGFTGFMGQLNQALEASKYEPHEDKKWNEFDYEKLMRESDARTDKYSELLDKYMDHADRDRIIAKEMGWTWLEEALDEQERSGPSGTSADAIESAVTDDEEATSADDMDKEAGESFDFDVSDDAALMEPDPATEGVDWVRDENGHMHHPLTRRAMDGSMALWRGCKERGLTKTEDPNLHSLLAEYQITGAKIAGALDGLAHGRHFREGAMIVACLKRALGHLHAAQAALEEVVSKDLLPNDIIASARAELFAVREEILRLMEEFRREP